PAFEGAKIECGMRGALGAVDHIHMEGDRVVYSTIGGAEAVGICGSGLMDVVAMLLDEGFLEDTGRLMDPDELENEHALANKDRIIKVGGKNAFAITDKVYISQKDIGEVQQAKAAIAAGVILLCGKMGIPVSGIEEVMIAGAFGNYMRAESACRIGLIPQELADKIHMIGNAAGEGAKIAVLNEAEYDRCDGLIRQVEFLELAADPDFNDTYLDELMFLVDEE
ncbi:MAG TPA: ferredoxin, partial [Lachnospiraceae bacterium]|nr:ferredoxin [Lachnospiraceae bacterium]